MFTYPATSGGRKCVPVARNRGWLGPEGVPGRSLWEPSRLNLRGQTDLLIFTICEVRRSHDQLLTRLLFDPVVQMKVRRLLQADGREPQRASLGIEHHVR
jgi:hypothetical protein